MLNRMNKLERLFSAIKDDEAEDDTYLLGVENLLEQNKNGKTPIEYAADLHRWNWVKLLSEYPKEKKDADYSVAYGYALKIAINEDQNEIAEFLLNKKARTDFVYTQDTGFYALHRAIEKRNLAIVQSLLEQKANPSIKAKITKDNDKEITPLELAIQTRQPRMIKLLIKAGENQSLNTSKGDTPIKYAANLEYWDCIEQLIEDQTLVNDGYALVAAVSANQNKLAESLMNKFAEVDGFCITKTGYYPLHTAISKNNIALVKSLLEHKADPSIKTKQTAENNKEKTPLEIAIETKQPNMIKLLLEAGANQALRTSTGEKLLKYASKLHHWDCVKQMLEFPSSEHDDQYDFVLLDAIREDQDDIAKCLIKKSASVSTVHYVKSGHQILHTAIDKDNTPLVKLLLDFKGDPFLQTKITKENNEQITAIDLALRKGNRHIIDLLTKENGVKQKLIEECFSTTLSYRSACEKMNKILDEYKFNYEEAATEIQLIKDESSSYLLKLALLNHYINSKHIDHSVCKYTSDAFTRIEPEAHPFIAQSILETILKALENQSFPKQIRKLQDLPNADEAKKESCFNSKELSQLLLLENEYSRKEQDKISDINNISFDKAIIYKIAALKYIQQKISLGQYTPETIENRLSILFGKDLLKEKWYEKNLLKQCMDNIKAKLKNQKIDKPVCAITTAPMTYITSQKSISSVCESDISIKHPPAFNPELRNTHGNLYPTFTETSELATPSIEQSERALSEDTANNPIASCPGVELCPLIPEVETGIQKNQPVIAATNVRITDVDTSFIGEVSENKISLPITNNPTTFFHDKTKMKKESSDKTQTKKIATAHQLYSMARGRVQGIII